MKIDIGTYRISIAPKPEPPANPYGSPDEKTRAEVIAGENPCHWKIKLIRGRVSVTYEDHDNVIPMSNKQALLWGSNILHFDQMRSRWTDIHQYILEGCPYP